MSFLRSTLRLAGDLLESLDKTAEQTIGPASASKAAPASAHPQFGASEDSSGQEHGLPPLHTAGSTHRSGHAAPSASAGAAPFLGSADSTSEPYAVDVPRYVSRKARFAPGSQSGGVSPTVASVSAAPPLPAASSGGGAPGSRPSSRRPSVSGTADSLRDSRGAAATTFAPPPALHVCAAQPAPAAVGLDAAAVAAPAVTGIEPHRGAHDAAVDSAKVATTSLSSSDSPRVLSSGSERESSEARLTLAGPAALNAAPAPLEAGPLVAAVGSSELAAGSEAVGSAVSSDAVQGGGLVTAANGLGDGQRVLELQRLLASRESTIARLSGELASALARADAAEGAAASATARAGELEKEAESLDSALVEAQARLDKLGAAAARAASAEAALREAERSLREAERSRSEALREVESLKGRQTGYEAQIREAYREMTVFRAAAESLKAELAGVDTSAQDAARADAEAARAEAAAALDKAAAAAAELDAARASHAASLAAARAEVARAEAAAEAAVSEGASARRAAQVREEELSAQVAELGAALAAAQRFASGGGGSGGGLFGSDGSVSSLSASGFRDRERDRDGSAESGGDGGAAAALTRLQAQLVAAEGAAASSRASAAALRSELERTREELALASASSDSLRRQLAAASGEREAAVADLQSRLASAQAAAAAASAAASSSSVTSLESRVASLVSALAARTGALERAHAEGAALRHELACERAARAAAEAAAASASAAAEASAARAAAARSGDDDEDGGDSDTDSASAGPAAVTGGSVSGNAASDVPGASAASDHTVLTLAGGSSAGGLAAQGMFTPVKGGGAPVDSAATHAPLALSFAAHITTPPAGARRPPAHPGAAAGSSAIVPRLPVGAAGTGAIVPHTSGRLGTLTPLTKIRPIAHSQRMTAAADFLDAATYRILRLLSRNPLARLTFVAYLGLLHAWCLFLVVFHTHALPHDAHAHVSRGGIGKP